MITHIRLFQVIILRHDKIHLAYKDVKFIAFYAQIFKI